MSKYSVGLKTLLQEVCPNLNFKPTSVAQLDACPTGDQEIAGSTPARWATLFRGNRS